MPTYVLMTKLSPDAARDLEKMEQIGKELGDKIREKCPEVKWICHYTLLGPYDFLDIYEAPSEEVAAKVSMITLSFGMAAAESWTAISYDRFLDLVKEIG
ncbi:MAG: GYD domain-containing protein [bacterium]